MATNLIASQDDLTNPRVQRLIREALFQHENVSFLLREVADIFNLECPPRGMFSRSQSPAFVLRKLYTPHIREDEPRGVVNTPKPTSAEEAATSQASPRLWSCFLQQLVKSNSPVPKHLCHDSINKVHIGSLMHGLDETFESPSMLTISGLSTSSCEPCEPVSPSKGISHDKRAASTIITEQDIAEDAHEDEAFYDAQTSLLTEQGTVAYTEGVDTSNEGFAPVPLTAASNHGNPAKGMDDTLYTVDGNGISPPLQSRWRGIKSTVPSYHASPVCAGLVIKAGEVGWDARQILGLSPSPEHEIEQNHGDVKGATQQQEGKDGQGRAEQPFELVEAEICAANIGCVVCEYLNGLSDAEAGLSTLVGPPRALLCYGGQEYKVCNGVPKLARLDREVGVHQGSLMKWPWRYSAVRSLCSATSDDEELILESAKKLVEMMATEGDTCRIKASP